MLRGDPLNMAASYQCSSGAQEAVRPLIAFRCATLVEYNDQVPEMVTFLGFLRPQNGHFWTAATICHNLQRIYTFFHTDVYKS